MSVRDTGTGGETRKEWEWDNLPRPLARRISIFGAMWCLIGLVVGYVFGVAIGAWLW